MLSSGAYYKLILGIFVVWSKYLLSHNMPLLSNPLSNSQNEMQYVVATSADIL